MNENQFVVDLGDLPLTDDQRKKINAAIQKAVAGELANIELDKEVILVPVNRGIGGRGGIRDGIIVRDLRGGNFDSFLEKEGLQKKRNE